MIIILLQRKCKTEGVKWCKSRSLNKDYLASYSMYLDDTIDKNDLF